MGLYGPTETAGWYFVILEQYGLYKESKKGNFKVRYDFSANKCRSRCNIPLFCVVFTENQFLILRS